MLKLLKAFRAGHGKTADVEAAIPPASCQTATDAEALVALAYRAVLRREPDLNGLTTYVQALREGHDLTWLIEALSSGGEFRSSVEAMAKAAQQSFWFDDAPPMAVDLRCTPEELAALWNHVEAVWSGLGETNAHWSVLTESRYRAEALGPAELAEFYESGEGDARRLDAWLRRAGLDLRPDGVCAEYGCGVGRITHALARRYRHVVGFDVSGPHLRAAQAQMEVEGIGNVDLVQVRGPADLGALDGLDAFYSIITLQHSPPPIIMDVLTHAFAALRPGGYAFFQLPTYAQGYSFSAAEYLAQLAAGERLAEMEMHCVPQGAVLNLAHRAGLAVAEVLPDGRIGRPGEWCSSAFLLVRK